eukprot:gene19164-25773_t
MSSRRLAISHWSTYWCAKPNNPATTVAKYARKRKGNVEILHLVHKLGSTITPVIVFIKPKGVAVQPGDEAIGCAVSAQWELRARGHRPLLSFRRKRRKAGKQLQGKKGGNY